jgi:hypothetical protein
MSIFVGHRNTERVRTSLKVHGQLQIIFKMKMKNKKGWRANLGEEEAVCEEALLNPLN